MTVYFNDDKSITMPGLWLTGMDNGKKAGINYFESLRTIAILEQEEQKAFTDHDDMRSIALYDSIVDTKRIHFSIVVQAMTTGTIADIIGNNDTQKARGKTLYFLNAASDNQIHDIGSDIQSIVQMILDCYTDRLQPEE